MAVYEESHRLFEKAESGDFDERDLYVAMEVMQRYIDILDEMQSFDFEINTEVVVRVEGETIKFLGIEDVAQWLTSS